MTAASNIRDVAVILTCFNEGAFIGDAVRSVLDQTQPERIGSIVIADDGSAPETIDTLRRLEGWDARIQVLYGQGGDGVSACRNAAVAACSEPILALLDGDDLWTPDRLARQLPALDDPTVGLIYSDVFGFPDGDLAAARPIGVADITAERDLTRAYFLNDPPIIPSTTLIRRTAFDAVGGFDASVRVFEDTDFLLRLAGACRFALVDAPLVYKRARSTSITGGRKDLMAHHAFVAFRAAAMRADLLPLVPRRLAERARKLGNHRFLAGETAEAAHLLRLAVRLDPGNLRAWVSWVAVGLFPVLILRLTASRLKDRRAAMGINL